MFNTERLSLRAYKASDVDEILSLYNDPLTATYITEDFVVPRGPKFVDRVLAIVDNALMFCVVESRDTGVFMGFSGIMQMSDAKNRNATFAIALRPGFWNKGYGGEVARFVVDYAFRCLAMHRVSLTVFEGNERALALYRNM